MSKAFIGTVLGVSILLASQAAQERVALGAATETQDAPVAWIGIVMSELPEPLAAHLGLKEQGIMIINVAEGSPAEKAGLQKFDVLVSCENEELSSETAQLGRIVRLREPGDVVHLKILRNGAPMDVAVQLKEHPAKDDIRYIYEVHPKTVVTQELKGRGQIIRKDDEGNWVVEDLGDIGEDDFSTLFLTVPGLEALGDSFLWEMGDEDRTLTVRVTEDGKTVEIQHGGDEEPITVTRTTEEAGKTDSEVRVYEDEEQLREEDPGAYEIYKKGLGKGRGYRFHVVAPQMEDLDKRQKEWALQIRRSIEENRPAWQEALQDALETARKAQEEAIESYREAFKAYEDSSAYVPWLEQWKGKWPHVYVPAGKATTAITIEADGKIHVITTKGDSTLERVFQDEDELREHSERLYEKYLQLQEAEESSMED
ncbi:MAG: PDZ domain-containing protein [Phycisphaerales bacterium]|nr:MAG: PDZ domain-containing protein [Phycisphaerales bacterium]